MRWQGLFADLEGQAAALEAQELDTEVAERTRRETALVDLAARLRPLVGSEIDVAVHGAGGVRGVVLDLGPDWLLLDGEMTGEVLVPTSAVLSVAGVGRWAEPTRGQVASRLDLRWALRALVRARSAARLTLRDASTMAGTLDRVGADHLDLAVHPEGEPRRAGAVRQVRTVPLSALSLLRPD